MNKTKSIGCAVLFGALTLICLFGQVYGCMLPFLIIAAIFSLIAWRKHKRDMRIIVEAHQEQIAPRHEMELPPMTSKGSNGRLFVPPPLQ